MNFLLVINLYCVAGARSRHERCTLIWQPLSHYCGPEFESSCILFCLAITLGFVRCLMDLMIYFVVVMISVYRTTDCYCLLYTYSCNSIVFYWRNTTLPKLFIYVFINTRVIILTVQFVN